MRHITAKKILVLSLVVLVLFFLLNNLLNREKVLKEAYNSNINWFVNNQSETGDLNYKIDILTGNIVPETASESAAIAVRKLSALHTLSLIHANTKDQRLKKVVQKGVDYYRKHLLRERVKLAGEDVYIQRLEFNDPGNITNSTNVFLLLTLIEYLKTETQEPGLKSIALELGNYLLTTQLPNGGFQFSKNSLKENDYHNGQSLYALAELATYTQNPEFIGGAEKAAQYFIKSERYSSYNKSFYSWGMRGFSSLYHFSPKEEYKKYIKTQTDYFLETDGKLAEDFFDRGKVPLPGLEFVVYTEGLLDAQSVLDSRSYDNRIKNLTKKTLFYTTTYQINGPNSKYKSSFSNLTGSICSDPFCKYARIDMSTHTLYSLYRYLNLE